MPKRIFEILGPIMIGPSSSHTAGAARIGRMTREIAGDFTKARCMLHGSFASTYKGHGTDIAIAAGLIGIHESDERLRDAFIIAQSMGKEIVFETADLGDVHENTAKIILETPDGTRSVTGCSIGGGNIRITDIDDFRVNLTGNYPTLVIMHNDKKGMIAEVSGELAKFGINIGTMEVSRTSKGELASMIIECDGQIPPDAIKYIQNMHDVIRVAAIRPLD